MSFDITPDHASDHPLEAPPDPRGGDAAARSAQAPLIPPSAPTAPVPIPAQTRASASEAVAASAEAAADHVRTLARQGELATAAGEAATARAACSRGVYVLAWPIVFSRITRHIELRHGHVRCAQAVQRLAPECLDRFHNDVEAVVEDTLAHADRPIRNLEAWIATRLTAATVNAHRKARGDRGALQRPRAPKWLTAALGGDPWLVDLSVQILVWAGLPGTAGSQLWPLDAWTQRRIDVTGDWAGTDRIVLRREIDQVLAAMRRRGAWYADYVERPLGRKETPTVSDTFAGFADGEGPGDAAEPPALVLTAPHEVDEARLTALAEEALAVMRGRIAAGETADAVVADVVRTVFGGDETDAGPAYAPHEGPSAGEVVTALLDDPGEIGRLAEAVLEIIGEGGGADGPAGGLRGGLRGGPVRRSGSGAVSGPGGRAARGSGGSSGDDGGHEAATATG